MLCGGVMMTAGTAFGREAWLVQHSQDWHVSMFGSCLGVFDQESSHYVLIEAFWRLPGAACTQLTAEGAAAGRKFT